MKVWPFFGFLYIAIFVILILAMSIIGISDDLFMRFVLALLVTAIAIGFFYFIEEIL